MLDFYSCDKLRLGISTGVFVQIFFKLNLLAIKSYFIFLIILLLVWINNLLRSMKTDGSTTYYCFFSIITFHDYFVSHISGKCLIHVIIDWFTYNFAFKIDYLSWNCFASMELIIITIIIIINIVVIVYSCGYASLTVCFSFRSFLFFFSRSDILLNDRYFNIAFGIPTCSFNCHHWCWIFGGAIIIVPS